MKLFRADSGDDFQGIFGSESMADFSHLGLDSTVTPFEIDERHLEGVEVKINNQYFDYEKGMDLTNATIIDHDMELWANGEIC